MISCLRGNLLSKEPPRILIDVNGVGYECEVSMQTFYGLPAAGESLLIHTHLQIREDAHQLYGFLTTQERTLFRQLIKINGIGPKVALALLSSQSVTELKQAIFEGNTALLTKAPGVGKKTAERLVIELRDKLTQDNTFEAQLPQAQTSDPSFEAISALVALGFKEPEAKRLVQSAHQPGITSEALIKAALQA